MPRSKFILKISLKKKYDVTISFYDFFSLYLVFTHVSVVRVTTEDLASVVPVWMNFLASVNHKSRFFHSLTINAMLVGHYCTFYSLSYEQFGDKIASNLSTRSRTLFLTRP